MRALGFCVSIAHAEFMARRFTDAGLPSQAVSANTDSDTRRKALADLQKGSLRALFAVDLFNEGVDLPAVDTLLFLRPTESALVFMQQLGRGLRRFEGKDCVTVLDFIGQSHRKFRFDLRYRAVTGGSRTEVSKQIEQGFPVPSGWLHDAIGPSRQRDRPRESEGGGAVQATGDGSRASGSCRNRERQEDQPRAISWRRRGLELIDIYRSGCWSAVTPTGGSLD